jgi:hypothetical protein
MNFRALVIVYGSCVPFCLLSAVISVEKLNFGQQLQRMIVNFHNRREQQDEAGGSNLE